MSAEDVSSMVSQAVTDILKSLRGADKEPTLKEEERLMLSPEKASAEHI